MWRNLTPGSKTDQSEPEPITIGEVEVVKLEGANITKRPDLDIQPNSLVTDGFMYQSDMMTEIQKSRIEVDEGDDIPKELLTEFEKVSERLVQLQKYLRKWLKDGCYIVSIRDSYRCAAQIVNIIEDEAFDRLNSVNEHMSAFQITECCMALNIIEYLGERSSNLNTLHTAKETSEAELMSILESLCKNSDVLEDIKTFRRLCQESGWPSIILKLNARMMTDVELLITRQV
ncbi:uncharacterized protein [Argopecten irradians]|uniref:uncharacterized protein n=1 Tax=Argopecten irradians TaxID=31199 RepID=UPI003711D684